MEIAKKYILLILAIIVSLSSCKKNEIESPSIVGVWKSVDYDDRADYYKLDLKANKTFTLRVDFEIPNNTEDYLFQNGTYEFRNDNGVSHLFLNYDQDGSIVQRTLLVVSFSNNELTTSSYYANSNQLKWRKE